MIGYYWVKVLNFFKMSLDINFEFYFDEGFVNIVWWCLKVVLFEFECGCVGVYGLYNGIFYFFCFFLGNDLFVYL